MLLQIIVDASFPPRLKLGKPLLARLSRLIMLPKWWKKPETMGGATIDLQIHDLDFSNWIFGKAELVLAQGVKLNESRDHILTTISYAVFAWAFDRLVPTWLADISERFHTPIKCITLVSVVAFLYLVLDLYVGVSAFLWGFTVLCFGAFMWSGLAAMLLPYRGYLNVSLITQYYVKRKV